ncbi:MAG: (d)CMP kinase [Syntrophaceae bacterium]|nr:(d)CMP kinase [Syntrophaceae bacterium]
MIITIDGPAGAGKSTVSKALAEELGYLYLDTGSLYRALAYKALENKIPIDDEAALVNLCSRTEVDLKNVGGKMKVYLDGEDVGAKIRTQEVGSAASKISAYATVRQYLLSLQRRAGDQGGIVAEGRDMGSVVFPDADYKFYLDANTDERIKRRLTELLSKGTSAEYQNVQKEMIARDQQDSKRQHSPLKVPEKAIIIDSTVLSPAQVVDEILKYVSTK